ncbi:MAG: hypothetical protein GW941_01790 [Candidatus Pacebacteria bacterium]|nr:hypothetical protein [Candidatus Paceibacterota bacterium]
MIQKVLVTPIIGLPQINGWAQVTQSPDGNFITVFSIQGSQAGNVGRDLVDLIKSNSPESATSVYSLMKKIIRFVSEKDCQIEISASYLNNGKTIFTAYNGSLLLKRNGKVGSLLKSGDEIKIIEGQKSPEDIFVLLTNSSLEFKGEIFQKLSQGLDADTTVASIIPGVQKFSDSSLISMAFLSDLPDGFIGDQIVNDLLSTEDDEPLIDIQDDEEIVKDLVAGTGREKPLFEASVGKKKFKLDKGQLIKFLKNIILQTKNILIFLINFFKKILTYFRQVLTNEVYVSERARIARKRVKLILIILGFVILISIPFLFFRFRTSAQVKEATEAISQNLVEFEQLKDQNNANPIETREKVAGILDILKSQEKLFLNKKSGQNYISDQVNNVQQYYDSISGKEVFTELPVFYDFQLIESDFSASQVKLFDNKAYFFDKDKRQIVELELENKKVRTIEASAQEESLIDFTISNESFYFLGNGIYEQQITDESAEKIIESGKSNESAKFISNFNDNIYVLNPEQRNIYKYNFSDSEYSDPIRWVKSAKNLEFDQIVSMVVDGEIWLSQKDGQIFRLSGGEGVVFEINGLTEPLTDQVYLYTEPDYDNIYLLEPKSSRLITVNKNGDFVKEVKSISLASAGGLIVDETIGKAIVISGSLVFEVGL